MPQFDLVPYLSQAFWMLLSFGFLYLIVAFLIFPMIEDVLVERGTLIKTDLEIAEKTNTEADKLVKQYNEYILSAKQEKAMKIKMAYEEMHKASAFVEQAYEADIREKIQKTEKNLQAIKKDLHAQSNTIAVDIAKRLAQKLYGNLPDKKMKKQG